MTARGALSAGGFCLINEHTGMRSSVNETPQATWLAEWKTTSCFSHGCILTYTIDTETVQIRHGANPEASRTFRIYEDEDGLLRIVSDLRGWLVAVHAYEAGR